MKTIKGIIQFEKCPYCQSDVAYHELVSTEFKARRTITRSELDQYGNTYNMNHDFIDILIHLEYGWKCTVCGKSDEQHRYIPQEVDILHG